MDEVQVPSNLTKASEEVEQKNKTTQSMSVIRVLPKLGAELIMSWASAAAFSVAL